MSLDMPFMEQGTVGNPHGVSNRGTGGWICYNITSKKYLQGFVFFLARLLTVRGLFPVRLLLGGHLVDVRLLLVGRGDGGHGGGRRGPGLGLWQRPDVGAGHLTGVAGPAGLAGRAGLTSLAGRTGPADVLGSLGLIFPLLKVQVIFCVSSDKIILSIACGKIII